MKQLQLTQPGTLVVGSAPTPVPGRGEVLVNVHACGVCGSDRAFFTGEAPVKTPVVLGHEYAGTVVAVGEEVIDLRVGDRVVVDPNVTCGRCVYCRRGLVNQCVNLEPLGIIRPGGFAEFSAVPERNAYKIPDSMPFEEAAFTEPLACCVRGIQVANVELGDVVVVLGAGPIGLMLAQLANLRGASKVICSEPSPARRKLAAELGCDVVVDALGDVRGEVLAHTNNRGADVVIEASGRIEVAELAMRLVRGGGAVVLFGGCPQDAKLTIHPLEIADREISIRGSNINPFTHQTALTLIESGRVRVRELIGATVGLEGVSAALGPEGQALAGKTIIVPSSGN